MMTREEALAKVGTRICVSEPFYKDVLPGTTDTVIHANIACRFANPEYGYADLYELVVAWDLPLCSITTMDEGELAWHAELA
jgi:hypothetical protein